LISKNHLRKQKKETNGKRPRKAKKKNRGKGGTSRGRDKIQETQRGPRGTGGHEALGRTEGRKGGGKRGIKRGGGKRRRESGGGGEGGGREWIVGGRREGGRVKRERARV